LRVSLGFVRFQLASFEQIHGEANQAANKDESQTAEAFKGAEKN
jgi:hypothetical protein